MLQIAQSQIDAFAQAGVQGLAPRIDAWLLDAAPAWAALDPAVREAELAKMLDLGQTYGMHSERDYAVFAWVCAILGPGWADQLSKPELRQVLQSPEWTPEAKLMRLDETFKLDRRTR